MKVYIAGIIVLCAGAVVMSAANGTKERLQNLKHAINARLTSMAMKQRVWCDPRKGESKQQCLLRYQEFHKLCRAKITSSHWKTLEHINKIKCSFAKKSFNKNCKGCNKYARDDCSSYFQPKQSLMKEMEKMKNFEVPDWLALWDYARILNQTVNSLEVTANVENDTTAMQMMVELTRDIVVLAADMKNFTCKLKLCHSRYDDWSTYSKYNNMFFADEQFITTYNSTVFESKNASHNFRVFALYQQAETVYKELQVNFRYRMYFSRGFIMTTTEEYRTGPITNKKCDNFIKDCLQISLR